MLTVTEKLFQGGKKKTEVLKSEREANGGT